MVSKIYLSDSIGVNEFVLRDNSRNITTLTDKKILMKNLPIPMGIGINLMLIKMK
jgi:hypothetical protein